MNFESGEILKKKHLRKKLKQIIIHSWYEICPITEEKEETSICYMGIIP